MLQLSIENISKKYNYEWIFKNITYHFTADKYAIIGKNGSGKSTLLQIISSYMMPSNGSIKLTINNAEISNENYFKHFSICAPYLELIEEMTAKELIQFHQGLKPMLSNNITQMLSSVALSNAADKQIRYYSSGMKQRMKLLLAFYSKTDLLILDEPCSNLDKDGIAIYHTLINELTQNRIVLIGSNDEVEIQFCKERININQYK